MLNSKVIVIAKRFCVFALAASTVTGVTGCGKAIALTQEQQNLVVEYSAQSVLKHDKNYKELKVKKIKDEQETTTGTADTDSDITPVTDDNQDTNSGNTDSDNEQNTVTDAEANSKDMAEAIGMSPVTLTYTGMDVTSKYPDTSDTQFVLNATEGKSLLVLKYNMTNNTASDINVPMMASDTTLKASVNGKEHSALLTLLLDALNTYTGTISPGQSIPLVLVFQISQEEGKDIQSLNLIVKSADAKTTFNLK